VQRDQRSSPIPRAADAYAGLGKRLAESLATESEGSQPRRRRPHASVVVGYLLALPVWAAELGLAWLGIYLLTGGIAIGSLIGAGLCAAFVWGTAPRPRRLPQDRVPLEIPALEGLTRSIAATLSVRPPTIVFTDPFDTYTDTIGVRRRSLLVIGIPMFASLSASEQTAVIAHELAHQVNHDPTRSWFVSLARQTLHNWWLVWMPRNSVRLVTNRMVLPAADSLVQVLMRGLAGIVAAYDALLVHPFLQDVRRAEHRADVLARGVAGTRASADALRALGVAGEDCAYVVMMAAGHPQREAQAAEEFLERVAIPNRRAPGDDAKEATLDATHPPLALRLRVIESVQQAPAVRISAADEREIHDALVKALPGNMRRMIESYRDLHGL
jgi:hypothetical protein